MDDDNAKFIAKMLVVSILFNAACFVIIYIGIANLTAGG